MRMKEAIVALGALVLASCGAQPKVEMTDSGLNPANFQVELNGKKTYL